MRIALLADIHANLEALEACLTHAAAQRADRLVFLGDLVGYGANPAEVTARVEELVGRGALALRGNHDEAALTGPRNFSRLAATAIQWTATQLTPEARRFLAGLPMTYEEEDRLYVHSEGSDPERWLYVTDATAARTSLEATDARLTFCGHTHVPALFGLTATEKLVAHRPASDLMLPLLQPRRWLAVVGAVGQPRDGNPAACYGMLDTDSSEFGWMRVPYDIETAAAKIRAAGLPDFLAERLFTGT
ncbi:metallophosphoesterase family protein [Roseococcus pinisoli]|uniref:Metallophosphoesterase family protein n=1 Tax=Roseococcus pinisoli TaxID=2835040 RepID=A0ABS5QAC4_9PROT|nr:metallophosphoesterase family protein [Roseococcus pinisoli]MBS7809538.1 metallophosphoesterase family protein [Roseococcus pinisoli]